MPPEINVRADLYELPHLFGFWLEDSELLERASKATGKRHWPSVILFFGSWLQMELSLEELEDEPGVPGLLAVDAKYRLGSGEDVGYIFAREIEDAPGGGGKLVGEEIAMGWAIHESGQLAFDDEDTVWFYNPATIEEIVAAGYSRTLIEGLVQEAKKAGFKFAETFNEETAEELKAESWKVLEKNLPEPL